VVADIWSQRTHLSRLEVESMPFELCKELNKLNLRIAANTKVMKMEIDSTLLQDTKEEKSPRFAEDDQGVLWYKLRICVPNIKELKGKVL
jgi:hypothetical protein